MNTLDKASREWATRPPDQRYSSLTALDLACRESHRMSRTATLPYSAMQIGIENDQPVLVGKTGQTARFTHWSFDQLCARVQAPASYLRTLPPPMVKDILTYEIGTVDQKYSPGAIGDGNNGAECKLLLSVNDDRVVKALTSTRYTRIWNKDITSRLIRLTEQNPQWQPAPAAMDGSRGLYASDRDMFAFLVDNDRRVFEKDPNGGLSRGFFCWNSEVGSATFGVMTFLYAYVCGNHIVWGASDVKELRIRHIGDADERAFAELSVELQKYSEGSAAEDEAFIRRAQAKELGKTKDEVLDRIFGLRLVSRTQLEEAYNTAELHSDWYGSPRSVWGMTSGMTELAKGIEYTDKRVKLEYAAKRVMDFAR